MNILILGGAGMLGHKMFQTLRARFPGTRCTVRRGPHASPYTPVPLLSGHDVISGVDVEDFSNIERLVHEIRPDVLINCVGVIKQRDAATQAIPSIRVNALLPHLLAQWQLAHGGRVIHFSTDCVFSGNRGQYTEGDTSDAVDLYGRTKYLGEVAADNALTIRTSIIGRELYNFASLLEWFLAQEGRTIRGFARVIYSGVTTNYLAGVVGEVIQKHQQLAGLHQLAAEPISKYDLLMMLREAFHVDVQIEREEATRSDRSLIGSRFRNATGIVTPSWRELVAELAADPTPYGSWR